MCRSIRVQVSSWICRIAAFELSGEWESDGGEVGAGVDPRLVRAKLALMLDPDEQLQVADPTGDYLNICCSGEISRLFLAG